MTSMGKRGFLELVQLQKEAEQELLNYGSVGVAVAVGHGRENTASSTRMGRAHGARNKERVTSSCVGQNANAGRMKTEI